MGSISVNGNVVSVSTNEVILDTSNLAISGDSESISNIYANIPGSAQVPNSAEWISTHVAGLLLNWLTDLRANGSPM